LGIDASIVKTPMPLLGSCIAGQADGVKVQIYQNDDCADEPQFYPVATDSCPGGNMKVRCNAAGEASIEIYNNNNQCNGNPAVSVTFTAGEDKCHSFGNPKHIDPAGSEAGGNNGCANAGDACTDIMGPGTCTLDGATATSLSCYTLGPGSRCAVGMCESLDNCPKCRTGLTCETDANQVCAGTCYGVCGSPDYDEEKAQPGDDQCPTNNEPDATNYCGPLQSHGGYGETGDDQSGKPSEWMQGFEGSCHSCAAPPESGNCASYTSMIEPDGCYNTCARK